MEVVIHLSIADLYIIILPKGGITVYTDEHLKWDKPPMAVCLFN